MVDYIGLTVFLRTCNFSLGVFFPSSPLPRVISQLGRRLRLDRSGGGRWDVVVDDRDWIEKWILLGRVAYHRQVLGMLSDTVWPLMYNWE